MKNKKGILIIEVLIGIIILSILVTSVIYGLEQTFKAFNKANEVTKTTYLAEELLNKAILQPESLDEDGKFTPHQPESLDEDGNFKPPFNNYEWKITREIDPQNTDFIKATAVIRNKRSGEFYAQLSSFIQEKEKTE